jgi:hypothetical protein
MNNHNQNNKVQELTLNDFLKIFISSKKIIFVTTLAITLIFTIYALNRDDSSIYHSTSLIKIGSYNGKNVSDSGNLQEDIFYLFNNDIQIVMRDYIKIVESGSNPSEIKEKSQNIKNFVSDRTEKAALNLISQDKLSLENYLEELTFIQKKRNQIINNGNLNELSVLIELENTELAILKARQKIKSTELKVDSYVPSQLVEFNKVTESTILKSSTSQVVFTGLLIGLISSIIISIGIYNRRI